MVQTKSKSRGDVAPGKTQVNWRILTNLLKLALEEARLLGFSSIPAFVNNLLTRYFNGETIKRGDRR